MPGSSNAHPMQSHPSGPHSMGIHGQSMPNLAHSQSMPNLSGLGGLHSATHGLGGLPSATHGLSGLPSLTHGLGGLPSGSTAANPAKTWHDHVAALAEGGNAVVNMGQAASGLWGNYNDMKSNSIAQQQQQQMQQMSQ